MARKGGFPNMGGNMNNMMKQVQKMQKQMEEAQSKMEESVVLGSAGGGAIEVKANGKKEIIEINIKPEVVDPDDIEMLEDLVLVAVNDALNQADQMMAREMGQITGGLNIPGL